MAEPFASAWKKLERADFHLKILATDLTTARDEMNTEGKACFTLDKQYSARLHAIVVFIARVRRSDPDWGLAVGDVLQNVRSALDHVAWELVSRGRTPPETLSHREQRWIQFPIHTKREEFNSWIEKRLPGVTRTQRAIVRSYQPYRGGVRRAEIHPLAVLNHYSNLDKHRAIQTSYYRPHSNVFVVPPDRIRDFAVRRIVQPRQDIAIEPGTELLRIYGRRTGPHPDCYVDARGEAEAALEDGHWLMDVLVASGQAVEQVVRALSPTLK